MLPGQQHQRQQIPPHEIGIWLRGHKNRRLGGMWFINKTGRTGKLLWWVARAPKS